MAGRRVAREGRLARRRRTRLRAVRQAASRAVRAQPRSTLAPGASALKADGQTRQAARKLALLREIRDADLRAGAARTDRTRTLGGLATLALTQPVLDEYRKVALVEPLARQLKLKKAKMEAVLQAYAQASDGAASEVVTAATFHTAALYQDFGKALLQSQRPKGLKKAALEQYNVMLEEQAFPFEEKATELHETNARRAASGLVRRVGQEELHRTARAAAGALRQERTQ